MTRLKHLGQDEAHGLYAADISVRIGRHASLDAKLTSAGLLSIGVLVSGILLSTATVVKAARRQAAAERGTVGDGC
jgi:hypothetical protein